MNTCSLSALHLSGECWPTHSTIHHSHQLVHAPGHGARTQQALTDKSLTLGDVLEGDRLHDALLHGHLLSGRGAIIHGGAGLLGVQVHQGPHCECGQHKPEEPQVGHSNPDPVPARPKPGYGACNSLRCCATPLLAPG